MRRLMNCDQVFDVLTRGPFPTGAASDAAVEQHLRACHECRQLAEALQPAVELLHESLAPEHSVDLPEYQGLLASVQRAVATEERPQPTNLRVRQLARPEPKRPRFDAPQVLSAVRLIAATVLISALGTLVWGLATTSRDVASRGESLVLAPAIGSRPAVRIDDQGLLTLASFQMPAGCFPRELLVMASRSGSPASSQAVIDSVQCCTLCHRAGNPDSPGTSAVAVVQKSCVACHQL